MYAYCVGELRMSEDTAYKRIQAARAARRFPAIFAAVADGRLHLSGMCLLAPHLTEDTAAELLASATHKTKSEIERLLAERFPRPDLPTLIEALSAQASSSIPGNQLAPGQVEAPALRPVDGPPERIATPAQLAPGQVATISAESIKSSAPGRIEVPVSGTRVKPLSPERFGLQVTVDQETHDLLRYAQALLGHALPSGDVASVLKRSLHALVRELEQQKFARAVRSRPRRGAVHGRCIPTDVRRAVWERDGGQCTFVSAQGQRCAACKWLEFDHVHEFARGGEATVSGIRLRCQAHNQYEAERTYGAEFMRHKRLAAAEARAARRSKAAERSKAAASVCPHPRPMGTSDSTALP
jgi:5-methylcytosine-specific restriction endonuclease McrA